ncbi:MAG TPA: MlaD family protein [Nitriliruptorales bacterium]|nr:MlaD family protein [Nitriliruptorales bacterium]
MRSLGRLSTNLATIVALTLLLVAYAVVQWVGGALFEDRYEITVPLDRTGGLFTGQEVTVLGHGVGIVEQLTLTDRGVEAVLEIRDKEHVPQHTLVHITRRSAVGEQALDLVPVPADWRPPPGDLVPSDVDAVAGWLPAQRDSRVEPKAVVYPTEVPEVLANAVALFESIDERDLGTLVHELASAIGGRAELLKELNRDSLDLNTTLVEGIPQLQRLLDTSGPLLDTLNEHRQALASTFPDLADVSETLAANRPTLERLLDDGPSALREAESLIVDTRANQHCLISDVTQLNAMLSQPENLHDLARGLDTAHWFYQDGFDVITQHDPLRPGVQWQRMNVLLFEAFGGQDYIPDRPTPPTKPGAACSSPWGVGVDAVRQRDHQPPDPTAPSIDFAPLAERGGVTEQSVGSLPGDATTAGPGGRTERTLPATGGGAAAVAPLALAVAWALRRRR